MSVENMECVKEAFETVSSLRNTCQKLTERQANGEDSTDLRRKVMTSLVYLRMLNKQSQDSVHRSKDDAAKTRQELDDIQLDMQNVLYQNKHLRSEIDRCTEYESKHNTIDMVSIDEFLEENPDKKELDEHNMTLERLKDEEKRRLDLFFIKTKLQETRKQLQKETGALREDLEDMSTFNGQIDKIIEGAEPLRKTLEKY